MTRGKDPSNRMHMLRKLLALMGAGAAIVATAPSEASVNPARHALEARVLEIRETIQHKTSAAEPEASSQLAQWMNWGNWNNWAKWNDWNNWPNWGNWGNWLNR